jgi:murein DD-endopeptidase MepM/ murein hydrolase activator NlpD
MPVMRLRRTSAVGAAVLVFAFGVAAALADSPTTTTETTTTDTTSIAGTTTGAITTDTSTTTETTTVAGTTQPGTTATIPTTEPVTTATKPPVRTTTAAAPARVLPAAARVTPFSRPCPVAAAVIVAPGRAPAALRAAAAGLAYPADGAVVTAAAVAVGDGGCSGGRPHRPNVALRSVSLFGDAVTVGQISLAPGSRGPATVAGVRVGGRAISSGGSGRIRLGGWGTLELGVRGLPIPGGTAVAALAVNLLRERAGLPAGTTLLLAAAAVPPTRATKRPNAIHRHLPRPGRRPPTPGSRAHHRNMRAPLKVTPPLGQRQFVFPVVGRFSYADSYGAFRSDVPGNWHHGDDLFAPLGTPVVAVASGTINRVGWEQLGGWRLWVRDSAGDEFYYAHLSGYAPSDLRSTRVRAGEVIGFVGNTGDAFTTSPHLHFEIHPRPLLHLGYDGAVDPTSYLARWQHLGRVDAPKPTHPALPQQPVLRQEARYVFRELLAARHLVRHGPPRSDRPHVRIPLGANGLPAPPASRTTYEAAPPAARSSAASPFSLATALLGGIGGLGALAVLDLTALILFRRRRRTPG